MRNKFLFTLILALSFGLSNASGQIQTSAPAKPTAIEGKAISGGILNGRATSLVKPPFPPAARAVGASGAVGVQVTIDEEGNVVSASAVSGHPLLRQVCEQAALASKFAPTRLEGQPVRITGVIVYNFVLPVSFTQIGYELALAEKSLSLNKFQAASIAGNFPKDWEEERGDLTKLDSYIADKRLKEMESQLPVKTPEKNSESPNPPKAATYTGRQTRIGTVYGIASSPSDESYLLDANSVEIIKQLQSRIENRLRPNEKILWSFNFGRVLGKLKAEIENDEKTQANISELSQLKAIAPSDISESAAEKVTEIIEISRQSAAGAERKEKLLPLIEELRRLKGY